MATKTITIDVEAYRRLTQVKRENESFSQIIKRVVRPPLDVDALLAKLESLSMSPKATAAVEKQLRQRHQPSYKAR
jgi:predicted CopG family antitoxin